MSEPSDAARDVIQRFHQRYLSVDNDENASEDILADEIQRAIDVAVLAERERLHKEINAALLVNFAFHSYAGPGAVAIVNTVFHPALPEVPDEAQVSDHVPDEDQGVCQVTPAKVDDGSADVEQGND